MKVNELEYLIRPLDSRRELAVPGDRKTSEQFCGEHFIALARQSIEEKGAFYVALAGGSTPKNIFEYVTAESNRDRIDWTKVWLFWSDERSVPQDHPDSNFAMAMTAGLDTVSIGKNQIYRMRAEEQDIEAEAARYEEAIKKNVPAASFDLIMLGMGDDGHTASLFPKTKALHTQKKLVAANYVPQKGVWRMTLTYDCIHKAKIIAVYVLGETKTEMLKKVLQGDYNPDLYPSQRLGTERHKALWIADKAAAKKLAL